MDEIDKHLKDLNETLSALNPTQADKIRSLMLDILKALADRYVNRDDEASQTIGDANLCISHLMFDLAATKREKETLERRLDG